MEIESEIYEYWLQVLEAGGATVYQQQFSFWHYHRVAQVVAVALVVGYTTKTTDELQDNARIAAAARR